MSLHELKRNSNLNCKLIKIENKKCNNNSGPVSLKETGPATKISVAHKGAWSRPNRSGQRPKWPVRPTCGVGFGAGSIKGGGGALGGAVRDNPNCTPHALCLNSLCQSTCSAWPHYHRWPHRHRIWCSSSWWPPSAPNRIHSLLFLHAAPPLP
jgi:hypothetical protein